MRTSMWYASLPHSTLIFSCISQPLAQDWKLDLECWKLYRCRETRHHSNAKSREQRWTMQNFHVQSSGIPWREALSNYIKHLSYFCQVPRLNLTQASMGCNLRMKSRQIERFQLAQTISIIISLTTRDKMTEGGNMHQACHSPQPTILYMSITFAAAMCFLN